MTAYTKTMGQALREVYLVEDNMSKMKKAAGGSAQTLKMKDGNLKMDSFTASAIMKVYDAVNDKNKKMIDGMLSGKRADIMKLQKFAMSKVNASYNMNMEEFEEEFNLFEHKGDSPHKHPHDKEETGDPDDQYDDEEERQVSEGRMKDLHGYIQDGKTAEQIAKLMKLDVKTIKSLMAGYNENLDEKKKEVVFKGTPAQIKKQMQDLKKKDKLKIGEAYKPIKSNHYDVKIQGIKKKDVNAILKYIKVDGGNYDIEDIDADQVTGGGMSSTSDGDIFIQGDDAGKLGMEIANKFRNVKVMGEGLEADLDEAMGSMRPETGLKGNIITKLAIDMSQGGMSMPDVHKQMEILGKKKLPELKKLAKELQMKQLKLKKEEVDLDEGSWHIAKNMNALKKKMQKPIPKGDLMVKFVMKHIGDDELTDEMFDAKTGTDMVPMIKSAMKRLNIKEEVDLDEGSLEFSDHDATDKNFQQLIKKNKLKIKSSGDDTVVTGDAKGIEKLLQTMYGNDWKNMYSVKGGKYTEEGVDLDEGAAADARRAISKDKDIGNRGRDSADSDAHGATDDDIKGASKNIIMQLRKAGNRASTGVEFDDKKKVKVDSKIAQAVQTKYNSLRRPAEKQEFQSKIAKSYKDLLKALKEDYLPIKETILDRIARKLMERKND